MYARAAAFERLAPEPPHAAMLKCAVYQMENGFNQNLCNWAWSFRLVCCKGEMTFLDVEL